jgi:hypothetical protein
MRIEAQFFVNDDMQCPSCGYVFSLGVTDVTARMSQTSPYSIPGVIGLCVCSKCKNWLAVEGPRGGVGRLRLMTIIEQMALPPGERANMAELEAMVDRAYANGFRPDLEQRRGKS